MRRLLAALLAACPAAFARVSAENCAELCGSQAYFEPVLVDRRGGCQLLRPHAR